MKLSLPRLNGLNMTGISHIIVPVVIVLGVSVFGVYRLVASHADSLNDRLSIGQTLQSGKQLTSQDKGMKLIMQTDGNLVIYNHINKAIWNTNTTHTGFNATMQKDGNFVVYSKAGKAVWQSNTFHKGGTLLVMQNDANLVIYTSANKPVWQSNTAGRGVVNTAPTPPVASAPKGSCAITGVPAVLKHNQTFIPTYTIHNIGSIAFVPNLSLEGGYGNGQGQGSGGGYPVSLSSLAAGAIIRGNYAPQMTPKSTEITVGSYDIKSTNPNFTCSVSFKVAG
jgi:hypothetical protein